MERTFVVTVQPNGDYEMWEAEEAASRIVTGDALSSGSLLDVAQIGVDLYAAAEIGV